MARLKACSVCGKIHSTEVKCTRPMTRGDVMEHQLRQKSKWHKKSLEIRERSQWLCAVCLSQGIINPDKLEVHHIAKLKHNPDGLLDDSNLICLCSEHHKMADDGLIEPDELKKLAELRDLGSITNGKASPRQFLREF
mgnify:CR=1 FL=1